MDNIITLNKKHFIVFRSRIAEYLSKKGIKPESIQVDRYDSMRTIWIYKIDQDFVNALNYYEAMRNHDRRYKLAE